MIGFEVAGLIWSQFLQDDIDLNIYVRLTDELPNFVIGTSVLVFVETTYGELETALLADQTSSTDAIATENLSRTLTEQGQLRYQVLTKSRAHQHQQFPLCDSSTSGRRPFGRVTRSNSLAHYDLRVAVANSAVFSISLYIFHVGDLEILSPNPGFVYFNTIKRANWAPAL